MIAAAWAARVARHHRAILIGSAFLCLAAGLSLTRLRLDIDVLGMLPVGTPAFDDFKILVADFGQLDQLVILIDGPRELRERFADALTPRLAALDSVARVHGRVAAATAADALLDRYLFNYLPVDAYDEVAARLTPEAIDAQVAADKLLLAAPLDVGLARQVAEDPLGLRRIAARHLAALGGEALPPLDGGYLSSRDGGALLLLVRPTGSPFDIAFSTRLLAGVRAAIDATAAALGPPPRTALTGSYVFALEDAATMRADILRYTGLSLLGVLAVFWLGYGNLRILPFVTYPLVLTTLLTFAISLLLFDQLNALSLSFAAILYGLSIDSGIHFYSRLLAEQRQRPEDPIGAVAATLAGLGRANLASSTTTAVAFLVIGLSCLSTIRQLGLMTAVGMILTIAQFFVLYPALGVLLMRGRRGARRALDTPRLAAWSDAAQRRAGAIRRAALLVGILSGVVAWRVHLDPSLSRLRPVSSPALRTQEEIAARFAAPARAGAVLVRRAGLDAALADSERVASRLSAYRAEGLVSDVRSIAALLPSAATQRARLARATELPRRAALDHLDAALRAHGFKPDRFGVFFDAFQRPLAELVSLDEPALQPLELVVERHVRVHPDGVAVATYFEPAPGIDWVDLAARLRADLADLPVAVAARALLERTLHDVLRRELALFILLAVSLNAALLIIIMRSLSAALAVLTPVVLVVLGLFAGMWLANVPVDPINLVVTPLILGIGVDNGVYIATAARQRGSVAAAVREAGRAVVLTSLTTIAGFGFLAFSTYPPLATMGRLVAVGLALCLAATVGVLPAFLPCGTDRPGALGRQ